LPKLVKAEVTDSEAINSKKQLQKDQPGQVLPISHKPQVSPQTASPGAASEAASAQPGKLFVVDHVPTATSIQTSNLPE